MKKSRATEALRVATDIAAIKAALHKRGYRLRKQPKQPVWKVITPQSPPTLGGTGTSKSPRIGGFRGQMQGRGTS